MATSIQYDRIDNNVHEDGFEFDQDAMQQKKQRSFVFSYKTVFITLVALNALAASFWLGRKMTDDASKWNRAPQYAPLAKG
jgi:hypothetical protein